MFGREYDIVREFANYFLDYREEIGLDRWDDRITSTDGIWSGNLYDFGSQYMVGCGRRCRAHSVWTEKRDVWMKIPWKSLFARR